MAKDTALAERLFQSLLDHFWRARDMNVRKEIGQFPNGYTISYKKLVEASGVPLNPRSAGGPLFEIADYCKGKQWPPIHSLVVRAAEGDPGEGFFSAPGSEMSELKPEDCYEKWAAYVRQCAEFEGFPRKAPSLN
jgi:hypothetical protein